ncbi:hypothetical protein [Bradyrhizobium sp. USDA 4508]
MAMIYVRARPGRRAFFEGRVIPEDKFIPVTDTPYIRRLVDHWGDLELEGGDKPPSRRGPAVPRQHSPTE